MLKSHSIAPPCTGSTCGSGVIRSEQSHQRITEGFNFSTPQNEIQIRTVKHLGEHPFHQLDFSYDDWRLSAS